LLEATTALHAAGIKREMIGKYLWIVIRKYQKNTAATENFYKVLKDEEVVYEVEINIANNQTSTISVV
jgi:hypothetical protein